MELASVENNSAAQIILAAATFVTALAGMIGSIVATLISWRNSRKVTDVATQIGSVETKQDQQHLATNSRLDQLLVVTAASARAAGRQEVLDEQASKKDKR